MGRKERERPAKLAEKLLSIRLCLGVSQTEMWKLLGLEDKCEYFAVSRFESGRQEPSLPVLLRYAQLAGISTDVLIDDRQSLPTTLLKRIAK